MLNRKIAAGLLALLLLATTAVATSQYGTKTVAAAAIGKFQWGHVHREGLPTHALVWSADAADFWITLYPDSVAESFVLTALASTVPLLLPLPDPWQDPTSELWHVKFEVTAHSDSVYAIGIRQP